MSDSTDTSAIDDKNNELNNSSNTSNYFSNLGKFLLTVIILFIIIVCYYSSSGLLLYACKLGQSNILPTDFDCYPYKKTMPNIQPIQTNIFTTFTDPEMSMKLSFPYDKYNYENIILNMFREYKNNPKSHFLANYFISIIENVIHFNYSAFNTIFNLLNSYIPEVLIVLFGPIIFGILSTVIFIIDHLYLIYLWFSNMSWFFKTNNNEEDNPKWEEVGLFSPFNYFCAICLIILFVILFFFALPLFSLISSFAMMWCIFSCMTYKAKMNNKEITGIPIIQDVFKYYKFSIMSLFSLLIIVSAFTKLGTVSGVFLIITIALIYFGIIAIDIFKPINKDNLTPSVSYEQAKKTCSFKESLKKNPSFLDILLQQKGGNLTKELKNISKKLSRNNIT